MADQSALFRAFEDYAHTTLGDYDISEVLERLTEHIIAVLDVDGAGVSIGTPDGSALLFVTATTDHVANLETVQVEHQIGPCQEAWQSGEPCTVSDLRDEDRWPDYTAAALQHDMRAVAGIPMIVRERHIGALDIYCHTPREWPADEIETAQLLAHMATGYIINQQTLDESQILNAQLQHALNSRVIIEQAKGILAERHQLSPDQAWLRLRGYARTRSIKAHEVARRIIDEGLDINFN